MSFDVVLESFARTEAHIKEVPLDIPYGFQLQALDRAKELYLVWLDVYKTYANGYRSELLPRTRRYVIRMLNSFGDKLEGNVREVLEARIPNEAYILVNEFFKQLGHKLVTFVLAEGSSFEQTSIFKLISDRLNKLGAPRPVRASSSIEVYMRKIQNRDIPVIYYEQGQYDNVHSWPLLLHEAFHYVFAVERLDRLSKDCPKVSWLEEALIDMYIVNYFGPAYALSLATYLQGCPHETTFSHPSFTARIFIVLQYLAKMKKDNKLPLLSGHISDLFDYLLKVWNEYKKVDTTQVQEEVEAVYNNAQQGIKDVISEKTQTFSEFLTENEKERRKIHGLGGFEYVEKQVLSISDVWEYFKAGIPVAADPRIVFNAFISRKSREMIRDPRLRAFIIESLKKWHVKNAWLDAKAVSH